MKELSIEEKAKAYDEAIERAKGLVDFCSDNELKTLEFVFSELKESGNIRIIKAIKYGLDHVFTNNTTVFEVTKEQCLAWLEKQGEHANFRNNIQIGDKVTRNEDGLLVNLSQLKRVAKPSEQNQSKQKPSDVRTIGYWNVQEVEQELAWSEKYIADVFEKVGLAKIVREQSNDNLTNALQDAMIELSKFIPQPNPAWSEEDCNRISSIKYLLHELDNYNFDNWLDSLKDRVQPKQKWSKEDKERYISCLQRLSTGNPEQPETINSKWFKEHVCPQNTWKPSDEHYELEEFAKIVRGNLTGISKAVQELFEAKYLQLTGNKMYRGFKD